MIAITNYQNFRTRDGVFTLGQYRPNLLAHRDLGRLNWILLFLLFIFLGRATSAAENSSLERARVMAQAERDYLQQRSNWRQNPTNAEVAWQFGRACFDWAEFAERRAQRAELAEEGIGACRQALRQALNSGPAHYYLALNLGQKARTDKLAALKIIHEMAAELTTAATLSPKFDYAGPDRSLGMLYRDAPGWPVSIGSRLKAREHLLKAVEFAPEYPENWLNLLEAYMSWGQRDKVTGLLNQVAEKLQAAHQQFNGAQWQWGWQDWNKRWEDIKASTTAPKALESPRSKGR